MHFTESFISVPILALYSTREITSNLSSAKMATKRFASHTESEINHKKANLVPKTEFPSLVVVGRSEFSLSSSIFVVKSKFSTMRISYSENDILLMII